MAAILVVWRKFLPLLLPLSPLLLLTLSFPLAAASSQLLEEVSPVVVEPAEVASQPAGRSQRQQQQQQRRWQQEQQQQQLQAAELCYLTSGGSSLTLTVNEATQVGSIIGTVEVNGDPALDGGNVDLFEGFELSGSSSQIQLHQLHNNSTSSSRQSGFASRALGRRAAASGESQPAPVEQRAWPHPPVPPPPQQEQPANAGPPVRLEPGSRNLVLVRPLDKESQEGEQSLVLNVRCRPRESGSQQQDSTTIPIRISITDANDNAPEFGSKIYVLNISETAPIGSIATRDILAHDKDSAGPHSTLHYRVLEDSSSHRAAPSLLQFANPLDPTLLVAGQLDFETMPSFSLTIVAQDQGEPEPLSGTAQVQVNIIDFDDQNPKFLDDKYTLIMDESQQSLVGQTLQVLPRNLYAEDGDKGIGAPLIYSFQDQVSPESGVGEFQANQQQSAALLAPSGSPLSASADNSVQQQPTPLSSSEAASGSSTMMNLEHYLHLNPSTGELRLIRQWPAKWLGAPMTLVVRATQADNKDRYALTTLTITRASATNLVNSRQLATAKLPAQSSGNEQQQQSAGSRSGGIEFTPNRLTVEVLENVAINEKIARVRARYLGPSQQAAASGGESDKSAELSAAEQADASQSVDLVSGGEQPSASSLANRKTRVAELQKRPISYQILDDQTDQFGINGLGEIFVKRPLDYEQRQEFKFRVLATYTKFSDICQIQVNVLNVNDNKPKFTQPQYTFHLTESRLKSNAIGSVQAHDADLNDTLNYSLFGEQAHLFEISPAGQISLRPSIKQLNMSHCQLIVQVQDSLKPVDLKQQQHSQQARVHLHIAPQLIGRSLNFDQQQQHHQIHSQQDNEVKLFNSRSLTEPRDTQLDQWTAPIAASGGGSAASGGRRALGEQFPAPASQRSSVATVMSSLQHMVRSVNFFDMPMSSALLLSALLAFLVCLLLIVITSMSIHLFRRRSKQHRRRQQLAHIRHAHLAAATRASSAGYLSSGSSSSVVAAVAAAAAAASRSAISSPSNSSPTNSTAAGGSPSSFSASTSAPPQQHQRTISGSHITTTTASSATPNPTSGGTATQTAATTTTAKTRPSSAQANKSNADRQSSEQPQSRSAPTNSPSANPTKPAFQPKSGLQNNQQSSLISSSLSSHQSKRSYRSNTTDDDSSVMHCGHYSVNASCKSPTTPLPAHAAQSCSASGGEPSTSVEAAIKNLVRVGGRNSSSPLTTNLNGAAGELAVLTSGGKPGIKSYRRLPLLGSLARTNGRLNRVGVAAETSPPSSSEPYEQRQRHQLGLMAMLRDPTRLPVARAAEEPQQQRLDERHLKAQLAIRWPQGAIPGKVKKLTWDDELSSIGNELEAEEELEEEDGDCFVAPDCVLKLGMPISPLGSNHQYPIEGTTNNQDYFAEQHFLFSNQCSPDPLSSHQLQQQPQTQLQANQQDCSSLGQNNCFDYTIVQSSQFQVDAFASSERPETLSAQHLLQQQQQQQHLIKGPSSYLYSNSTSFSTSQANKQRPAAAANQQQANHHHQDLRLMTTAVL